MKAWSGFPARFPRVLMDQLLPERMYAVAVFKVVIE